MSNTYLFNNYEELGCGSWRRAFESSNALYRWVLFHLFCVFGSRSKEQALVSIRVARKIHSIYRSSGYLQTALYLKVCRISLYRCLAAEGAVKPHYTRTVKDVPVSLARSGLPRIIPSHHRKMMLKGGDRAEILIRMYATIFSLYKLIVVKPKEIDVSAIVDPSTAGRIPHLPTGPLVQPLLWLRRVVPDVLRIPLILGLGNKLFRTAGPNTPSKVASFLCYKEDAHALLTRLIPMEIRMMDALYDKVILYPSLGASLRGHRPSDGRMMQCLLRLSEMVPTTSNSLGRMGIKIESAGKVRLFAMLDSISQRLLQPLHEWVFEILRRIPQDGTFNQTAPLLRIKDHKTLWSFDLTAATDRLPMESLVTLLSRIFPDEIAPVWEMLMYRSFDLPMTGIPYKGIDSSSTVAQQGCAVIFCTGTPLGSLSSWGIFTLFHHLLVQLAYAMTGKRDWFTRYAILGDDLVIADKLVAGHYKTLLKGLGVSISQSKSLTSTSGTCEFASRFLYRSVDLSPISFKALVAAKASASQIWSFFLRLAQFRPVRESELFRVHGAGYKTLSYIGRGFRGLHRFTPKWRRRWLVIHHPSAPNGMPWEWWLVAGRNVVPPPFLVSALHHILLDKWYVKQAQGWSPTKDCLRDDDGYEALILAPWFAQALHQMSITCQRLMAGELIDPLLDHVEVCKDGSREPRLATRKYSLSLRLYDIAGDLLARGPPKSLGI